jgi:hypothetical protein
MSTELQKNLAQNIVKNLKRKKPLNKQELVISSGYAVKTAEGHAPDIMVQEGVKNELKILGFDEDSAKKVVSEIMLNPKEKAEARLKATDQVFKVHGSYEDTKNGAGKTIVINIPKEVSESFNINAADTKTE